MKFKNYKEQSLEEEQNQFQEGMKAGVELVLSHVSVSLQRELKALRKSVGDEIADEQEKTLIEVTDVIARQLRKSHELKKLSIDVQGFFKRAIR